MQSLTKEAEQKLIAAIERAAELVNTGMSPNDAIVKSASAANVPAGHINLMVHAYNTGRTTKQREQGEDTLEKAADFQLADAQTVMDALYPKAVKTSAEIVRQQVVSTDYAVSPAGMLARRRAEQEKAAAANSVLPEKTWTPPPRDERYAVERAYSDKRAAERAQEELRRQATDAYVKAAASLDQLIEYFRTPGNMTYGDALKQAELRFGFDGVSVLKKVAAVYPAIEKQSATKTQHFGHNRLYDLIEDALTKVSAYVGAFGEYSPKKASAVCKKTAPEFLTGSILSGSLDEPLELMKAAGPLTGFLPKNKGQYGPWNQEKSPRVTEKPDELRRYDEAAGTPREEQRELEIMRGERAKDRASDQAAIDAMNLENANEQIGGMALTEFGHNLFPIIDPPTADEKFKNFQRKMKGSLVSGLEKLKAVQKGWSEGGFKHSPDGILSTITSPAVAIGKNMGMSVGSALGNDKKPEDVKKKHVAALSNPQHEAELRSIRAKGTLHDLMLNDPVISGYDPAEVAVAFNDVSEVAPNLIDSPGVLQAVLRKRLEGGQLADFDLKQLLEMDKLRLERDKILADTKHTEQDLI